MGNHAELGPSNTRWPYCAGSVREEARYEDVAGAAAIDGTGSHLLLEMCLENNVRAESYDMQTIGIGHEDMPQGWVVDIDRCKRVQMCLDYVSTRVTQLKAEYPGKEVVVLAESKSDPGGAFGRDNWWGTVDITIMVGDEVDMLYVEVIDYKDGRGWVSEKDSTQLIAYLFGKLRPHIASGDDLVRPFYPDQVKAVRMTIVQPKTAPVVRYSEPGTHAVARRAEELAWAAELTTQPDAALTPGKHCQWCKANPKRGGHCAANSNESLNKVINMSTEVVPFNGDVLGFFDKVMADPKSLTEEQLGQLADAEAGIQAIFTRVREEIQSRIEAGIEVNGYAMAAGRGRNVWLDDEETTAKKLKGRRMKKEEIYPAKLISPAQVLKLASLTDDQKKRIEKDMISFTAGKLSLQKVEYVKKDVDNMFNDVPQLTTPSFF